MGKKPLVEAAQRRYMTARERALKKALIALLRDDGQGHHHNKYADRLEKFDVNIVPLSVDPECTAWISFENGVIGIGEGFVSDPTTFWQLNVVIRHELAHNLMMHEVRFAQRIPNYDKLAHSATIQELFNIIADDEISNTRYSEEDKNTMRHLQLGARIITALVTEDHREDWSELSLTQMVDKLEQEIKEDTAALLAGQKLPNRLPVGKQNDPIRTSALNAFNAYQNIHAESSIPGDLKKFLADGCWITIMTRAGKKERRQWADPFRELAQKIYDNATAVGLDDAMLTTMLSQIAATAINSSITLFRGKKAIVLYTPEEKYIAEEVLKKFRTEYAEWYAKVKDALKKYGPYSLSFLLDNVIKGA